MTPTPRHPDLRGRPRGAHRGRPHPRGRRHHPRGVAGAVGARRAARHRSASSGSTAPASASTRVIEDERRGSRLSAGDVSASQQRDEPRWVLARRRAVDQHRLVAELGGVPVSPPSSDQVVHVSATSLSTGPSSPSTASLSTQTRDQVVDRRLLLADPDEVALVGQHPHRPVRRSSPAAGPRSWPPSPSAARWGAPARRPASAAAVTAPGSPPAPPRPRPGRGSTRAAPGSRR